MTRENWRKKEKPSAIIKTPTTNKEQMTLPHESAMDVVSEDDASSRATKRPRNSPVVVTEKTNILLAKTSTHSYTQDETQDSVSNLKSDNHSYHESIYEPDRKISANWTGDLSHMAFPLQGAMFPPPTTRTRRAHMKCIERQADR